MTAPYWTDGQVTLYLGDCREITEWLAADVLVTDPPYGRGWRQGKLKGLTCEGDTSGPHPGIAGDLDTAIRDTALSLWGDRLALVFGDLMLAPPTGTRLVGVFRKAQNAGMRGAIGGWRRDAEAIYVMGPWKSGLGGRSSVIATALQNGGGWQSPAGRYGHPHAKPIDVMETLIGASPAGTIADPFAGSGSTLVAARNLGRRAVGVELDERYAERAARRLDQMALAL